MKRAMPKYMKCIPARDQSGQYFWNLSSNKELDPGEVIMRELPFVVMPDWDDTQVRCSNCFTPTFLLCKACRFFPLCDNCEEHDAKRECNIIKTGLGNTKPNEKFMIENYKTLGIVRFLIALKDSSRESYFLQLRMCNIQFANDDIEMWRKIDETIVYPILNEDSLQNMFYVRLTLQKIRQLYLLINGYSMVVKNEAGLRLRAVYTRSTLLPHSCIPQVAVTSTSNFELIMYATVKIKVNQTIYNTYTNVLIDTAARRNSLLKMKNISCACERCLDPTEMGSHMGTLICPFCTKGYLMYEEHSSSIWKCEKCFHSLESTVVCREINKLKNSLTHQGIDGLLSIIKDRLFHPNHFFLYQVKEMIVYKLLQKPFSTLTMDEHTLRMQYSEELVQIIHSVSPGISLLKGTALTDYLICMLELACYKYNHKIIGADIYLNVLHCALIVINDIYRCVKFENQNTAVTRRIQFVMRKEFEVKQLMKDLLLVQAQHANSSIEKPFNGTKCHKN